jgi:excisionase family DNA binding protein
MPRPKRALMRPPSQRQLNELPAVLSVAEVATVLRVSRNIVYEALHSGQLPGVRLGRRFLVPTTRLRELLGEKAILSPPMPPAASLMLDGEYVVRVTYKGKRSEGGA